MWHYDGSGRRAVFETRDRSVLLASYEVTEPDARVSHTRFVRAASGRDAETTAPADPVSAAEEVRRELEAYGDDFLSGDAGLIRSVARELDEMPTGFAAVKAAEERIKAARETGRA